MLSLRAGTAALRRLAAAKSAAGARGSAPASAVRRLATKDLAEIKAKEENDKMREALEAEKGEVAHYVEKLNELDAFDAGTVWSSMVPLPDPDLPEDPSELSALDPAHEREPRRPDGRRRTVVIRQQVASVSQSPLQNEDKWLISFQDDGEFSETWDNPLMGWTSGADPMSSTMRLQMHFDTAADAVYFAKKRGWQYVVEKPIMREGRSDDAQYQDNFLPQAVAAKVRMERTKCDHWHQPLSGASHYRRPLKFHGDGEVGQYGPNPNAKIADHVEGQYKLR